MSDGDPRKPTLFDLALEWLWPAEGGWYDGSKAYDRNPTNYGITQRTYDHWRHSRGLPNESVRSITLGVARQIYHREYWLAGGCNRLDWPMALVHFDACVNHGVGNANWLLDRALNPWHYIALRDAFYDRLVERNPRYRGVLNGWHNRMNQLRKFILAHPSDSAAA